MRVHACRGSFRQSCVAGAGARTRPRQRPRPPRSPRYSRRKASAVAETPIPSLKSVHSGPTFLKAPSRSQHGGSSRAESTCTLLRMHGSWESAACPHPTEYRWLACQIPSSRRQGVAPLCRALVACSTWESAAGRGFAPFTAFWIVKILPRGGSRCLDGFHVGLRAV